MTTILDNIQRRAEVVEEHEYLTVFDEGHTHRLRQVSYTDYSVEEEASGNLISPMPGRIVEVMVNEGQQVRKGETLLVVEAMKIEHMIAAPHDGTVQSLHYRAGEMVDGGVELLVLADI